MIYFSDSEVGIEDLKWIPDPRKFRKRRLYFLHSLAIHQQMDILFRLILHDKQVDSYQLFAGQEDTKIMLQKFRFNLDDIIACV